MKGRYVMKLDDLDISAKLVDIVTGEIIGYRFTDGLSVIVLSEGKVKELGMDCASYIDMVEAPLEEVVYYNGRFATMDKVSTVMEEYRDIPFERLDTSLFGTVAVYGNVVKSQHFVSLDDDDSISDILASREQALED